jgi:hypothetical protein
MPTHEQLLSLLCLIASDAWCVDRDEETGAWWPYQLTPLESGSLIAAVPWNDLPTLIPDNAHEIAPDVAVMALEMCDSEVFLALEGEGPSGRLDLMLNANDRFAYACADAEPITWNELPRVWRFWKVGGDDALLDFVARRRKWDPIPPLMQRLRERFGVESYGQPNYFARCATKTPEAA